MLGVSLNHKKQSKPQEVKVWYCFLIPEHTFPTDAVLRSLIKAGIECCTLEKQGCLGLWLCLIFFNEINEKLFDLLLELNQKGFSRILLISTFSLTKDSYNEILELLNFGASYLLCWEKYLDPIGEIIAKLDRWFAIDQLLEDPLVQDKLIGKSPAWILTLRQIVEIAHFTPASVLITGETGTGKELVAHLIHSLDSRPQKRNLIIVDCTTLHPELVGSELFGHEKGSFTSAITSREGAFALANGGTLFLDEIGELPLKLQGQLLRVIQEGTYKRVGSNTWCKTSFRLVCATNRNLPELVKQNSFREDLYHRIAGRTFSLPPLRERIEDIIPLAQHFIQQILCSEKLPELDGFVENYLLSRKYPSNIRDLKRLATNIAYRHTGSGIITVGDIPEEERPEVKLNSNAWYNSLENLIRHALSLGITIKEINRITTDTTIKIAINNENGNLQRAARKLGVTDRALQKRRAMQRENILDLDSD